MPHLPLLIASASLFLASLTLASANIIRNGDFELGTGEGDRLNFNQTSHWFNRATEGTMEQAQGRVARRLTSDRRGVENFSAVINDRRGAVIQHLQRTEYTVRAGDTFSLSYEWRTGEDWDRNRDRLRFVLFATDTDTLRGTILWEVTLEAPIPPRPFTWEMVEQSTRGNAVPASADGRILFLAFYGYDPQGTPTPAGVTGFGRVNNIVLTANP
jgi:hypothetical protein